MTVRPGKKFGFQSAAENLQRRRRPNKKWKLWKCGYKESYSLK